MAKNDYFVIAYRILAYLYECMKNGVCIDTKNILYIKLDIHERYWKDVIEILKDEGYIKNAIVQLDMSGNMNVNIERIKITQKGIEFLQDNSNIAKAKEFLKTVKEIIPGL